MPDVPAVTVDDSPLRQPPFVPSLGVLPDPAVKLEPMEQLERGRLRAAAFRATKVYPGPVGELVSIELMAWSEWGYRLGSKRKVMALVEHIEAAEIPTVAFAVPAA